MLAIGRGNAQLVLRLDEARLQVDPLISEGIHCGVHTALMLVGSHYGSFDFDLVGRGYVPAKSDSDIFAIGSAAAHGEEILASKMSATCVRRQYQTSSI